MPSLYRLRIGPLHTAYYQQHFDRFEAQGRATPTWNLSAACFTLAWLLLRQMYRPAMVYGGCVLLFVLLWLGVHGAVPMPVEAGLVAVGTLALCLVPGLMANALYYHHVRHQTLAALNASPNVAHAQRKLQENPVTKDRLHIAIAAQTVAGLVIAALLLSQTNWADLRLGAQAPVATSGPPDLVIPSVADISPAPPLPDLPSFTPDMALPGAPEVLAHQPVAPAEPKALQSTDLSIVQLAQSVAPAAAGASAAAAINAVAEPATAPAPAPKQAATPAPSKSVPQAPTPAPQPKLLAKPAAKPVAAPAPKPVAAPAPAAAVARPASGMVPGKFYLNAGVYAQAANVDRAVKSLQSAKLPVLRQGLSSNKGELTRLRIGPFDTRAKAEAAAAKAKQLRFEVSVFQHPLK